MGRSSYGRRRSNRWPAGGDWSPEYEVLPGTGGRPTASPRRVGPVHQGAPSGDGRACCWPRVPDCRGGAAATREVAAALLGTRPSKRRGSNRQRRTPMRHTFVSFQVSSWGCTRRRFRFDSATRPSGRSWTSTDTSTKASTRPRPRPWTPYTEGLCWTEMAPGRPRLLPCLASVDLSGGTSFLGRCATPASWWD
jgi:hypothetical protein